MDEKNIQIQEQEDPLAGWKIVSSLLLSVMISIICCGNGEAGYYSLLIFFPVKRILSGILDNRFQQTAGGLLLMLAYLVLLNSIPLLNERTAGWFHGKKISPGELKAVSGVLITGIFIAAAALTSLAGKAFPDWKIPARFHSRVLAVVFVFTLGTLLTGIYFGLDYCNGRYFRYPPWLSRTLPFILMGIGACAVFRLLRKTLNPPAEKKESGLLLAVRPKTKLSDVAGMDEVKEQIRLRLIEPVRHPKQARKYGLKTGGGVLL